MVGGRKGSATAESGAHQHMAGGKSTVDSSAAIVMHGRRRTLCGITAGSRCNKKIKPEQSNAAECFERQAD